MKSSLPSGRLHFAAHSHHPWPDVTRLAHDQYWVDSTEHLDSKWGLIYSKKLFESKNCLAEHLGYRNSLESQNHLVEGANTFEFLTRLLSCFDLQNYSMRKPVHILTTDSEFHSFSRLQKRLSESQYFRFDIIPTAPFETFAERFCEKASEKKYDFIFSSLVFFNTGFFADSLMRSLAETVDSRKTIVVIDLYHAFAALPLELEPYKNKFFFVGGGYKYASSGEGACFLSDPLHQELRPWQTGWFADFTSLENISDKTVCYPPTAQRFAGATFDPAPWYRFCAVMSWWKTLGLNEVVIHNHVRSLQSYFCQELDKKNLSLTTRQLVGFTSFKDWGHFLSFEINEPNKIVDRLRQKSIYVDSRGRYLRFGFGYYQDQNDVQQLLHALKQIGL